jgi:alkanesulfonate monooxygenase SsuD/methylene tetrahydromethanopterin reductase-like flavin-dependent oxidoreductase (luciferase family)
MAGRRLGGAPPFSRRNGMKIDMFCEVEKADMRPGQDYQLLQETLAQAELADRVGFDCWWEVEHHGAVEMSYSSAPEVILSAIAQRTSRMRIGHGAVLAPHNINHPIRIAERAATLDLLSNGRLEMGFARSTIPEWRLFGVDPAETRAQHVETMHMVSKMWTQERFTWETERFQIKNLAVIPKPYQQPHPPMWAACTSPDGFRIAGELGVGALGVTLMTPVETMKTLLDTYREAVKDANPAGSFVNNQTGVFTFVHCAETTEKAIANGAAAACAWYENAIVKFFEIQERLKSREAAMARGEQTWQGDGVKLEAGAGLIGDIAPATPQVQMSPLEEATMRMIGRLARGENISGEEVYDVLNEQDSVIIGDPATVRRKMARYRDIGCDRLLCFQQVGGLSHEAIMESIRLVGEEVIPFFSPK